MRHRAEIVVTLKSGVLDIQGKAVFQSLQQLGYGELEDVRVGKVIHLLLDAPTPEKARELARGMCEDLLVNGLIEEYRISLEAAER
jgi:phosphoribosylformylglycinamidine synthase PurS subunit